MGDRFALSFEFFINVAHAFVDQVGTPEVFADLVWKQAQGGIRGETSIDAWETRNLAFGRRQTRSPTQYQRHPGEIAAGWRASRRASEPLPVAGGGDHSSRCSGTGYACRFAVGQQCQGTRLVPGRSIFRRGGDLSTVAGAGPRL